MDVFISYRRKDTSGYALGLRRELTRMLPTARVFLDVESLGAGVRWRDEISQRAGSCDVLLVLIGDEWLVMRDGERKLEDEHDPLRFELEEVLRRADAITVIPILVEEATMPARRELPRRYAASAITTLTRSTIGPTIRMSIV